MTCELCIALTEKHRLVGESELSFCIINIEPLKPGHVLILPKRHVVELKNLTSKEAKDLLVLCQKFKDKINKTYGEDSLILLNTGKHSSQKHLHFHIWPSKGDLRALVSGYENIPRLVRASKIELEKMKKELE
ncbi:MAG: HIT family protein [Candidatus Woesearchaeota archaeon]|jgi:ATP adenylyltransferase